MYQQLTATQRQEHPQRITFTQSQCIMYVEVSRAFLMLAVMPLSRVHVRVNSRGATSDSWL